MLSSPAPILTDNVHLLADVDQCDLVTSGSSNLSDASSHETSSDHNNLWMSADGIHDKEHFYKRIHRSTSLMTAFTAGEVARPLLAILLTKAITLLQSG